MPGPRAGVTSQREFSMNQAGRRNVMGIGNSPMARSMIVCWASRFGWLAPIVER